MVWKDFIVPIRQSGIFGNASYKILISLFEQAGSINDVPDATAKSWLSGRRNCKASTYFPAGKIDTKCLYRFFRNKPVNKLKQLQQMFRARDNIDFDSPINVETDNLDEFCWSLVNQFLDLLGFQRVDIPDFHTLSSDESAKANQPCDKCCLYCIHWQGDKSTVGPYRMPTYGICVTDSEKSRHRLQRRLSSSTVCANYQVDQDLISNMKRVGYNVDILI